MKSKTSRKEHWNSIFSSTADPELGWYEKDISQTLKFIEEIPRSETTTVFIPGAGTSLLVDELLAKGYQLILNDISDKALNKLRNRIGINKNLRWLHSDISKPLPEGYPPIDIWVDRAVLHFLLKEADIQEYFANLQTWIKPCGYALLAEFSSSGARKCAGLDLHLYSIEEIIRRMGPDFVLIKHEDYTYINPAGDSRQYIYALFQKHNS
jgi:hypothetical protein